MLKINNLKVRWAHRLPSNNIEGLSVCNVSNEKETILGSGTSTCSKEDNFCYDTGRKISLARALKQSNLSKKERNEIWEGYRNMTEELRW